MTDGIRDALGMYRGSATEPEYSRKELGRKINELKIQNANEVGARTKAERQAQQYREALEEIKNIPHPDEARKIAADVLSQIQGNY